MSKKVDIHIEAVQVACVANSDGYANGIVVKAGKHFQFIGNLKDGKFPLWCSPLKEFESEFSKLGNKEEVIEEEEVEQPAKDESFNPFNIV